MTCLLAPGPYEYSIFAEATTSLSHNSFPESSEAPGLATGGNAVEIQVSVLCWMCLCVGLNL